MNEPNPTTILLEIPFDLMECIKEDVGPGDDTQTVILDLLYDHYMPTFD